jgi:hypothetical protein
MENEKLDIKDYFLTWLEEEVDWETWDVWSEMIKAHDDFPLYISFLKGVESERNHKITI